MQTKNKLTLGKIKNTPRTRPGTKETEKHKRQVERKDLEMEMQAPPQFLSSEMLQKKTWERDHFLEKVSHSRESAWISSRPMIW